MPASRNDSATLAGDVTFQNRVKESLIAACIAIANEGIAIAFHRERARYATSILNAPNGFATLFANSVATDASVLTDATQAGTVVLTGANVAAQAALATDAHIDAAISAQFNSFVVTLG